MHQPQGGFEIERASGDQRAVFSEAVTGGQHRLHPVVGQFAKELKTDQGMGQQGGLGVAGELEVFLGTFQTKLEKIVADDVVGLLVEPAGGRKIPDQVAAHPDVLGTLSGENEHDLLVVARHGLCPLKVFG